MSKKYIQLDRQHPDYAAHKALYDMKYIDLQAAVVSRGMDFSDVQEGDHGKLASWFIKNYHNKQDKGKLEDFDIWRDLQLKERGHKKNGDLRKFRKFSRILEDGSVQVTTGAMNKAKIRKGKKPKRTRDNKFGIFTGTKKEYTYTLGRELFELKHKELSNKQIQSKYGDKMVARVKKKFPEAKDKSIKIWMSRCLKALRDGSSKIPS